MADGNLYFVLKGMDSLETGNGFDQNAFTTTTGWIDWKNWQTWIFILLDFPVAKIDR